MEIYERIKKRRKELGLSADEVAKALHVSRATIYRYESKEIEKLPTNIMEPLANVLKCSVPYLMGWDEMGDPRKDSNSDINYLVTLSQSLPPDQLERLISYAKFLKTDQNNN